jgi:thioesterase domain-containing protein
LAALFEYNTIKKLVALIQSQTILTQSRCLVPIRTTGSKIPLYIIHGGGLAVFCFKDITKSLDPEQPVYALQAMGIDGLEKPLDTVEAIAGRYISEILAQNPDGPYAFAGYSLGGVIAFEIVKQFRAMGKKVTTLAMFDSYAYAFESDKQMVLNKYASKTKTFVFRLKHLLSILRENPRSFVDKMVNIARYFLHKPINLYNLNDTVSLEIYMVYEAAVFNYQIDKFDGVIELFCSKNSIFYTKQDPIYLGWKPYAKIRRHVIEGNHYSMFFPPNVGNFAKELQDALDNGMQNPLN